MKPLGRKNYGSIGHLPNSRMGPADHSVHEGQSRICQVKTRDRHDWIVVTEKLDGSNVGIARVNGQVLALGRAGHLAQTSKYEQHQLFAHWVRQREAYWRDVLKDGERLVGEWIAQAHGTIYRNIPSVGPFVAFDLMRDDQRAPHDEMWERCCDFDVPLPKLLYSSDNPIAVETVMAAHGAGACGADEPEGVVYRVERRGEFDFMAKWVRPDKVDGKYLPEVAGSVSAEPVWNWRP